MLTTAATAPLAGECGRDKLAFGLQSRRALNDQLTTLRRNFDERLIALEAGLADPDSSPALESLVLEMVRAAGDEAEAAARDASLRAQRGAEAMLATALAQSQASQVELDGERALTASLRAEVTSLKEQLATAVIGRQDADAERQREIGDLNATVASLQRSADEAKRAADDSRRTIEDAKRATAAAVRQRDQIAHDLHARAAEKETIIGERDAIAAERAALIEARETLIKERDALIAQKDALAAERDAVAAERDRLVGERESRAGDRHLVEAERDALMIERNALVVERDALATARDTLAAERDRLLGERADFVKSHDAMVLQRDTLMHERDDLIRERDRQIAQLHKDLEARETALKDAAAAKAKPAAAAPAAAKKSAPPNGPARKSDRQAFSNALGVQIDGEAALLVDLSVTGAQVLSCTALKPTKTVKMVLPSSESPVLCRGRIVWARLEPTMPGKPIRYRAGMFFTATDQAAVQTFISRHSAR